MKRIGAQQRQKLNDTPHDDLVDQQSQGTFVAQGREDLLVAATGRLDRPGFKVNLVKEVKKDKDGIRKDIKNCKRRSRKYRSAAVYR
ncbi:hypothetical protein LR48_Vigan03g062800 [Vigna angularis]|uniref:Uncharacterized protein n=1 Tax=Phaseolus angularis TaxID=3914 RepID=A0A0L9U3I8_PHAAN|nr:hypothetical protein LR48_Vigan03g062800 [Vigna angularis]